MRSQVQNFDTFTPCNSQVTNQYLEGTSSAGQRGFNEPARQECHEDAYLERACRNDMDTAAGFTGMFFF